ncbi:MAG: MarR family transcriptional regulator [Eggerthella lenta]
MTDSFNGDETRAVRAMQRSRRERFTPPTPEGVTPSEARTMMTVSALQHACEDVRPGRVAELTTRRRARCPRRSRPSRRIAHRAAPRKRRLPRRVGKPHRRGRALRCRGRRLRDEHMDAVMEHVGIEDMRHLVRILRKVVEFHELDPEATCKSRAEGDEAPCA